MVSSLSGRQSQTTTSHEHHTPGETPNNQPDRPDRATSRNRSENPGEGLRKGEFLDLTVDSVVQIGAAYWLHVPLGKLRTTATFPCIPN